MRSAHGDAVAPLKMVGDAPRNPDGSAKKGTKVTFLPSPATFKITEFDFEKLEHRYRELAFLNSGVRLFLVDARHEEKKEIELFYEGGIAAFVSWLDRNKTPLMPAPIAITGQREVWFPEAGAFVATPSIEEARQVLRFDERSVAARLAVAEAYRAQGRLDLAL